MHVNPLLSILVPVCNEAPYIKQCLDSLLINTSKNYEIVVSDNVSEDGTWEILQQYEGIPKLTIIRTTKRISEVENVWAAFYASTGSIIYFCPGDDFLEPYVLDQVLEALKESKITIAPLGGYFGLTNIFSDELISWPTSPFRKSPSKGHFVSDMFNFSNHDHLILSFFPRDRFQACRGLAEGALEITWWWYILACFHNASIETINRKVLNRRLDKSHNINSAAESAKEQAGVYWTIRTIRSIMNAIHIFQVTSDYSLLLRSLFQHRVHSSPGGFLGRGARDAPYYHLGPLLMLLLAPFVDIYSILRRALQLAH